MNGRDTLLLACGTAETRSDLRSIFQESFNLLETDNSQQTMLLLKQNHDCIAAVLLDIAASEKINASLLEKIRDIPKMDQIPVLIIAGEKNPELVSRAFELGATDVVFSDYDSVVLLQRVETIVWLYRHKWHLEELVEEQAAILRHSNEAMIDALSSIIEYRSVESGQHILRIRRFTQILLEEVARNCPEYDLTPAAISIISSAAALHDIGKIAIPDAILNKPGKLTQEEWAVMKSHSLTGCQLLETLGDIGDPEYLRYAHNICHYHHERWNGGGYPEGIRGDDIPICAQVVGLADAYDALTSSRVYKEAFSFEKSVNMIINGECGVFSPKLLECFKGVAPQFEKLACAYADGLSPHSETFDVTLPSPVHRKGQDTLHNVQSKYQALLHYINGMTLEIDLNQQIFHMIYNPYPEMAPLSSSTSYEEAQAYLLHLVVPEEQDVFRSFLQEDIPYFLKNGMRKQIHYFHTADADETHTALYQITLLRPELDDENNKFLIIWQKSLSAGRPAGKNLLSQWEAAQIMVPCQVIYRNDHWHTLKSISGDLSALVGWSEKELELLFENHLMELVIPEDLARVHQIMAEHLENGSYVELTYRMRHKDGREIWVLNKSLLSIGEDGREYFTGILTDVTKSKQTQNRLQFNLQQYESIFGYTQNIIFEWDIVNDTISFSDRWYELFGYMPIRENVLSTLHTNSHFHPEDVPKMFEMVHNMQNGAKHQMIETRIAKRGGRYLWCRHQATALHDEEGRLLKIHGIILNVDDEKRAAQALQDRAERDALTKLFNKQTAQKQAEEYLSSHPHGAACALLIIDLDNFKHINDSFGHMFGDAVLTQAAKEIKKLFRAQDIVGRIGGDEFMVLMRDISDGELVEARCSRLISSFQGIYRNQLGDIPISCSIGVALSPQHGTAYHELFQRADQALYQAKDKGKNCFCFFNKEDAFYFSRKKPATAISTHIDSDELSRMSSQNIVQYTFRRLYDSGDVETTVHDVLALVGKTMNVSRVYIFENDRENKTCSNTFEWCNAEVQPEIQNQQKISYETDIPGYENNFNENGMFYCSDIHTLPKEQYEILKSRGIKSLLQCAIMDNGIFRGYVGFDECVAPRLWTQDQIDTLSFFSEMLSTFLLKKRAQDETDRWASDLRSVLDNQNAYIYVIDPKTCRLKFLNAKFQKLAPDARPGMFCYQAMMGREERCPGCPAKDILREKTAEQVFYNRQFDLKLLSEATLIQWENEVSCLLSCRKLRPEIL